MADFIDRIDDIELSDLSYQEVREMIERLWKCDKEK